MLLRIFVFVIVLIGCNNSVKLDEQTSNQSVYFYSLETTRDYTFFEIENNRINRYSIKDSLITKNVAHIRDLKLVEGSENSYILNIDGKELTLKSFLLNEISDFSQLYKGYWYYYKNGKNTWKKFIPSYYESFHYSKNELNLNESRPKFFSTQIEKYFDKFYFVKILEYKSRLFLITDLNKDYLVVMDIHRNIGEQISMTKQTVLLDLYGTWKLSDSAKFDEIIFTSYTLAKNNQGIINDGYYKDSPIYHFPSINGDAIYLVIRNNELNDNIIKMEIDSLNIDILKTTEVIQGFNVEYIRQ